MDRDLLPEELRRARLQRLLRVGLPLLLVAVLLLLLPGWLRPSISRARIRTAKVERGTVEASFTAAGRVVPAFEKVLSSPVESRVLRVLERPGSRVVAGQPIVELDLGPLRLDAARQEQQLQQKRNDAARERARLRAQLAALADQREGARLDRELATFRLEQTRRLHGEGLAAEDALRQAEVAERKARLEEARLQRETASAREQGEATLRALELEAQVLGEERAATARQLELGTARADRSGVVTWVLQQEGASVPRGAPVARVADLSAFGVDATVSDVHAASLRAGQPVRVDVGEATLDGAVETVYPTIEEGTVRFRVALAEPAHAALRNNLRVDVEVVTERLPSVLRLARGAALQGGRQRLFVVSGDRARRRDVELGASGPQGWEVRSGLDEGDEVILSDMTDYLHAERIRIR